MIVSQTQTLWSMANLRVELVVLVVHPAGSHCLTSTPFLCNRIEYVLTGQLLREVLVELVAILVKTNEGSGFGITCVRSARRPRGYAIVPSVPMCYMSARHRSVVFTGDSRSVGSNAYLHLVAVFL
jgi:hypothetical protein